MDNNKIDYNLLKTFHKVSELGSFTRASEVLKQPKSRVSRAISRLEEKLGVQLIRRTTRRTSLTSAGKTFYENISPLLNSLDSELANVQNHQTEMSGLIRLTASEDIAQTLLPKIISKFNSKHPRVEIQTLITNDFLDLAKENIDLSFRAGKLQDSILIQKKIMAVSFILVCSKKYLQKFGKPQNLKDLNSHKFLSFTPGERTWLEDDLDIKPFLKSDSIPMLLNMAINNDGITALPDYFCKDALKSGALVRIFPSWSSKSENIHMLYHPLKNSSKKIKIFIATVKQYF